jgi:hypothetical protein
MSAGQKGGAEAMTGAAHIIRQRRTLLLSLVPAMQSGPRSTSRRLHKHDNLKSYFTI